MSFSTLTTDFYRRDDVVQITRELIGKILCTRIHNGQFTSGIITETEAYSGRNDKASHAHDNTRTERTETMYGGGGTAYVYLCYGIHHLFNIVTNKKGLADAVLVRSIKPVDGIAHMQQRRNMQSVTPRLTAGPGRLTQALAIKTKHDGTPLSGNLIWIEDRQISVSEDDIQSTPRIGIDYAGEDARRPWRFALKNSDWVSN